MKNRRPQAPAAAIAALADPFPSDLPTKGAEVRVGFYRDRSWEADAIGYFGGGWWSHATSFVSADEVIDARVGWTGRVPPGVQRRPASYLDANPYAVEIAIPCTAAQRATWIAALESQLDQDYDIPGIFDFATGRIVDPSFRGKKHPWFCNALETWALQKAGIVRPLLLPPYRRTPGGSLDVCMATEGARITAYRGKPVAYFIESAGINLRSICP